MFDGLSIWHLLILFLIIILVFGSKKLVSLGPDLGRAMRGFKQAMHGEEAGTQSAKAQAGEEKAASGEAEIERAESGHTPETGH